MPKNVGRVGVDAVDGTGILITPLVPNVWVNGEPIAVAGTKVVPHLSGQHKNPANVMMTGSPNVFAGGKPVCGTTDLATCGGFLKSTSTVFVN
jgi:uncharacterized Zn-binding protein involved in type VI secretion